MGYVSDAPEQSDQQRTDQQPDGSGSADAPSSLTFRITRVSLLGVLAVAICASPLALSTPWLAWLFLIPVGLAVWVLRTRTVVDGERVVAQRALRRTRFGWDEISSFRLDEKRWVRAVLTTGREVPLPAVRVRDLTHLARLSGGRLPDPSTPAPADGDDPEAEPAAEDAAPAAEDAGATASARDEG